ncbi:MAG: DUF368 domain-containing protein, partial [Candidatus Gallimonas sp.]
AILGVYEKLVGAVADIFRSFKRSFLTLLPVFLGMALGVAALIYPIQLALTHYPIPTVTLFVGLALGGLPSVTEKLKGGRPTWKHVLACALPLVVAASLCFLPAAGEVDLFSLSAGGYVLLFAVGVVASCALVVPGISGSMLLLIFGYYNPVVRLITENLVRGVNVGISLGVLACLAAGILAGFFLISVLMKFFLKKYPRGTYFAIVGFIVGSIPAVYVSTVRGAAEALSALYASPWYWIASALLFLVGFALSFALVRYAKKKTGSSARKDGGE